MENPVRFILPTAGNGMKNDDARVGFIYSSLEELNNKLLSLGSSLTIRYGTPEDVWRELMSEYDIEVVYTNRDYEPYAIKRDLAIEQLLASKNISFETFKDHVIFEKNDVVKDNGEPCTIYTPYSRKWDEKFNETPIRMLNHAKYENNFLKIKILFPQLKEFGFVRSVVNIPLLQIKNNVIINYDRNRDIPFLDGTSRLGIHLRFGTLSIRKLVKIAAKNNEKYLKELIWREFYQMILWHFPFVAERSFKPGFDKIKWRNNEKEFELWCSGKTGYPLVDAGMRQLNETGFMHNRVRMVAASFLTKHLLIDWRWGEAYFAEKLLDYELASNNGGWQWAAGTGVDAAPYFRIFNPAIQAKKFDPEFKYIRKWIPEFGTEDYPSPIVEHKFARERCLKAYTVIKE